TVQLDDGTVALAGRRHSILGLTVLFHWEEEPTSSGTGYGKSRTLTGNEVLSRRQAKHDPPEILRGTSLGEGIKQKESKTTPQGKPGVISLRTPPQPHQYPEHDQRCHRGRPSDEKRGPSATTSPIRDQPTQQ
ncbi:hypothetical protein J6590_103301, partial [Homalodisca vitripennis]